MIACAIAVPSKLLSASIAASSRSHTDRARAAPSRLTISEEALLAHLINSSSVIALLLPLSSKTAFWRRYLLCAVFIDPFARGRDPLAGGNGCGMADHRHDVSVPAHLGAQNAEAVLGIVVGDALDKARQNFRIRRFRLRPHIGIISAHLMARSPEF